MLIRIGAGFVDPTAVVAITAQETHTSGEKIILIWLDHVSHPFIHDKFEGDVLVEVERVGLLISNSVDFIKEESAVVPGMHFFTESDGGSAEEMVRMPVSELTSRDQASFDAGFVAGKQIGFRTPRDEEGPIEMSIKGLETGAMMCARAMADELATRSSSLDAAAVLQPMLEAYLKANTVGTTELCGRSVNWIG